jgi:ribose 5-phosphate isomerase A
MADQDELKRQVGIQAAALVEPGMKLGLGTGSTAAKFVAALGARIRDEGLECVGVPTSELTRRQAMDEGIPLSDLDQLVELDLCIDGADEIDPELRLIKGGGGALLREKIVASASKRMVVIADQSKLVEVIGDFPLPVEIVRFGVEATRQQIEHAARNASCGGPITIRLQDNGNPFITDQGNIIVDCDFRRMEYPDKLAQNLSAIPGVVEHGLFIGMADGAIIATETGIETMGRV